MLPHPCRRAHCSYRTDRVAAPEEDCSALRAQRSRTTLAHDPRPRPSRTWQEEHAIAESTGKAVAARLKEAVSRGEVVVDGQDLSTQTAEPDDSETVSVVLGGSTPEGTHLDKLGVFMPTGSVINGRPT